MARALALLVLMLAVPPAWAADTSLGRLFFTPAERKALEEARRKNVRAEVQAPDKPVRQPMTDVTVSGVVRRSDGESTVWVNGKPVDGATADGLKVRITAGQQAAVIVQEPGQGRTVRLKVGQRADIRSGRIEEAYERRAAAPSPAASPEPVPEAGGPAATTKREEPAAASEPEQPEEEAGTSSGEAGGNGRNY